MNIATYQATPEKHGNETFFFTDCGHNMYSVRDDMAYHGCLCPACFSKGIQTILYISEVLKNQMSIGIIN